MSTIKNKNKSNSVCSPRKSSLNLQLVFLSWVINQLSIYVIAKSFVDTF